MFAARRIRKGEIVEVCPVVPLTSKESDLVCETVLSTHVFGWPSGRRERGLSYRKWTGTCVCLGWGSIYNHAPEREANLRGRCRLGSDAMVFTAKRDIAVGEELTHCYGWDEYPWEIPSVETRRKKKPPGVTRG